MPTKTVPKKPDPKTAPKKNILSAQNDIARDVGIYIFASNPYKAGRPPADTWVNDSNTPPPPTVQFPPADSASEPDSPYFMDFLNSELHEEPGEWDFKDRSHYIARGVRIPYMYYKISDADDSIGILVKDFFLIGFEGGVAYGKR